jgi:hypothetical protein
MCGLRVWKIVGFLTSLFRCFDRRHPMAPDSAKTYGNPARGTVCRNTDDFPVRTGASVIGDL